MILNMSNTRNAFLIVVIIFIIGLASWHFLEQRKGNAIPEKADLVYGDQIMFQIEAGSYGI